MKNVCLTLCVLLAYSSAVQADLRYTTHIEVRRLEPPGRGNDQDVGRLIQMLTPPGDTVTFVGADAVRIEQWHEGKKIVILLRPDDQIILDPDARTYTRVPKLGDVLKEASAQPPPRFRRTGDFTVIHGIRAERVEITMPVTLPVIPPPGFPTVVTMTGEVWLSNAFKAPGAGVQKALGLTGGLPTGLDGMILRQILRSAEFGYELESTVTELIEGPIAPETFSVPEGYREISPVGFR